MLKSMFELLISTVSMDAGRCQVGNALLHIAVMWGFVDIVVLALSAGADVNSANKVIGALKKKEFVVLCFTTCVLYVLQEGRTPLMLAALYGHAAGVSALLRAGADTELVDKVSYSQAAKELYCRLSLCCKPLSSRRTIKRLLVWQRRTPFVQLLTHTV